MNLQSSQGCKSFLKTIHEKTLARGKLKIPIKFVRNHEDELHDGSAVFLKVPSGKTWEVELRRCLAHRNAWLVNGWKEFADHYSIVHAHILVFQYMGNSVFTVHIFDKTATEIDYDSFMRSNHPNKDRIITLEDSDVEIQDGFSSFNRRRPRRIAETHPATTTTTTTPGMENLWSIIEKADAFKSENPFFWVLMHPTYVGNGSSVVIPRKFAKEYLKGIRGQVILRLSESSSKARSWTVDYTIDVKCARARFSSGWVPFMKENDLQVGDCCIFELIKGVKTTLQVLILRSRQVAARRSSTRIRQLTWK